VAVAILLGACGTTEPGPTGSRIVFRAFEPEAINLFSMNADGTDLRRVTGDTIWEEDPTWSPDGRKIAFAGTPPQGNRRDIYEVDADGSGLRKLLLSDSDNREPEWSPDGSRIAFSSLRVDDQGMVVEDQRIWVMQADGTGATPLVPGFAPSWSPDSRRLVFDRGISGPGGVETGLFLVGSDGSGEVQLTNPQPSAHADLYPNGRRPATTSPSRESNMLPLLSRISG
jgi:Tol biopolymer transport system component